MGGRGVRTGSSRRSRRPKRSEPAGGRLGQCGPVPPSRGRGPASRGGAPPNPPLAYGPVPPSRGRGPASRGGDPPNPPLAYGPVPPSRGRGPASRGGDPPNPPLAYGP